MTESNIKNAALKSYVERIERITEEIKESQADRREIYAEAKAHGFDTKTIRLVVAERAKDKTEREEQLELFQIYWEAVN